MNSMHVYPQSYLNPSYAYPNSPWPSTPLYQFNPYPYYAAGHSPYYASYDANMRSSSWKETEIKDYGKQPLVIDIARTARQNQTFRTALWTGEHFQVTVMSIPVGSDIGLEVHPNTDQFIRVEEGQGLVQMGDAKDKLDFRAEVHNGYAIMIPAGKWHNVTNTGNIPLKVYVLYAPPEHPFGTVHPTKADAMAAEHA